MSLQFEQIDAPMGAIVRGWQPGQVLSAKDRDLIVDALRKHLILIFRGQRQPTDGELISFAGSFGTLLKGSAFLESARESPEILHIGNLQGDDGRPRGTGGSYNMDWHADYSYVDSVGDITFLNAVVLPKNPPRTYFSNQYRALELVPPGTRERLNGLRAFHSISHYYEDGGSQDIERYKADRERDRERGIDRAVIPEAEHPVIVRHPVTGCEILYVGPSITRSIIGLSSAESESLLSELYATSVVPDNVYAHDWVLGDLVMFDTLGTLHKRDGWDPEQVRHMRQLSTICQVD